MATRVLAYSDSKVFGGAEDVFCGVAAGLSVDPSFAVTVAAPPATTRLARALAPAGIATVDVPAQALTLAAFDLCNPRRRRTVSRVMARAAPDVLLVNLPSAEYGPTPLRLAPRRARRIGLLHVAGSPHELGFRMGRARERLAKWALAPLDSVFVLSSSAADTFRGTWDAGGTAVHRMALPRPRIARVERAEARRRLALDEGASWIGIAGRISIKQKGHDTLVAALARLRRRRGSDIRLAVAGEGRDRAALERLARAAGVGEAIRFLGTVTPIDPFLGALDAIAIPSRFEGLPLIALEALAAGVPGVAAQVDGLRDVWPEEWGVPAGDDRALAERLAGVLDMRGEDRSPILDRAHRKMQQMTTDDPAAAVKAVVGA